ncbi:MAG: DUF2934 domain-containing protein [Kiritimatiellaeota bacterium]|nr:DUF2934 domain-containing protein [Kiritimatiellota bacterium]
MAAKTKKTSAAKKTPKTVAPIVAAPAVPVVKPTVSAVPAVKPVAAPAVPAVKPTVAPTAKQMSAAERAKMIEIAAYVLAEKNGFQGDAQKYWLQAEKDVDAKLGKK